MEIRKNIQIKENSQNLLRKKIKRPIIVQDIDSDNDIISKESELDFDNINLNFQKYCYLCHKEIIIYPNDHSYFKCITCFKFFHRECYKEYKLKQIEKDICKNIIMINKVKKEINNIYEKECILCIMQNNNFCVICKKKIKNDNELIIMCELCGNLMHYKCLDVPIYFLFYREFYKNIFINLGINQQKYKEFLIKIKEINNNEINNELLPKIYKELKILPSSIILNYLFYICNFCKTRNLYDLQEINVYKSTSFSKVNYYNTALNPLFQNINKVKASWNMNKIHEIYISSANPYNDALFDHEKYDSNYVIPKPLKIIKKYEYNRINNIIIKIIENGEKKDTENKNKINSAEEEEIFELSNIVQMFEEGEHKNNEDKINNKSNIDAKEHNKIINNNINLNIIDNSINNKINNKIDNNNDKIDVISENLEFNELEKSDIDSDNNIILPDKCFYLIKWDSYEYSLELDSFIQTFPNFNQILIDYNKSEVEIKKKEKYPSEDIFKENIGQILIKQGIKQDSEYKNLINNSFIHKKKEELIRYKNKIISIISNLMNNDNKYIPHILILNDNNNIKKEENNNFSKILLNNNIKYLDLFNNKQSFIYECINFSEDSLNVLKIGNNIYLNKIKENILENENIKRYINQNILIDNIDSINVSFMQEYHFDLIIFDLKYIQSLIKIKEFFAKIMSPLNNNYLSLKYILLEKNDNKDNKDLEKLQKIIYHFFNLFYHKEDTILLYGNYSGKNNCFIKENKDNISNNNITLNDSSDEKDNLSQINLIPSLSYSSDEQDLDAFNYNKNFINLNFSTLKYNDSFNGLDINNIKWAFYLDQNQISNNKFNYTQILSSLITLYDTKVYSLRNKEYNEIIMNFIPIHLDKETFIQYLYIIKNKPEVLLKTQENKKDLMQNILLLCSLPCCMTKFYKKYLEDYKVPIKDNINISKIDVFYQLSRLLLYKTKGKIIIIFPLHDKVYRENDSILRRIRKEIEKIFFSNINPENKDVNLKERKKQFFCFLMDEEGLFEEIKNSENAKYPTNIIIFNMFLQNKNTGEFFNLISKNKYRHKIILYQLYISNLIEGKLSQIFYSKLNQFIEICSSPLRKMKTTVYGQLTLSDKEIITITDLKKTFEKEISENNDSNEELDYDNKNNLDNMNIVISYQNLQEQEKKFDGFIYIWKNSYLICTNSKNINLRYDNIYNTFIGNVSFNNYDNALVNNSNTNNNISNLIYNDEKNMDDNNSGKVKNYNESLVKYKKKKFYQELDFLKDESNFENLKTNKYDLTNNNNDNNIDINNNNVNNNNANNNINNNNLINNNINLSNNRGEEVYILNDPPKKRGRKRKNSINNDNNINKNGNININNNEPIQIPNDEEIEEMNNSIFSDDIRSNNNNDNINNNKNIINNPIINNLSNINTNNNDNNPNNEYNNVPVNLDEITEDYSDTLSENSQERNLLNINNAQNNNKTENKKEESELQPMNIDKNDNDNNNELISKNDNNNDNNKIKKEISKDNNMPKIEKQELNNGDNNEKTYDIIKSIANSILSKKQTQPVIPPIINCISDPQDTEQIEKLINDTKFESSRDRLFKIYNYLLTKGFEEKTRKLFVKCLLNYGFPLVSEFDKFFILFQMNAQHLKIKNIPNRTDTQLYYELVYFILEEDESLDYNIFVFGEERTSLIRTKLLIIRQFQSFKDVTKAMYFFVKDRNNILFGNIEPKLDESYQRVHFVMAKLLSNLVNKSIKSGFLNYKNYIKDDNIIFDNIRIKKDGQTSVYNIREGIAKKIFGKVMNENEFNNAINSYYEALFVQVIKIPDNIMNNNDTIMR